MVTERHFDPIYGGTQIISFFLVAKYVLGLKQHEAKTQTENHTHTHTAGTR